MQKKQSLGKSFQHAFAGIRAVIRKERNMKIHCFAAVLVILCGILFHISRTEWLICLILFALVMSLEVLNTAIESTVDLVTEEYDPKAKLAKDAAAGAVLVAAIFAAVIGILIFLPKLTAWIHTLK